MTALEKEITVYDYFVIMPDILVGDIAAIARLCCSLNCGSSKDKVRVPKTVRNISTEPTAKLSILTRQKEKVTSTHSRPYEPVSLVPGKDVLPMTVRV